MRAAKVTAPAPYATCADGEDCRREFVTRTGADIIDRDYRTALDQFDADLKVNVHRPRMTAGNRMREAARELERVFLEGPEHHVKLDWEDLAAFVISRRFQGFVWAVLAGKAHARKRRVRADSRGGSRV